jgi:hypothetical protein
MKCKYVQGGEVPTKNGSMPIKKHTGDGTMKRIKIMGVQYYECPECGYAVECEEEEEEDIDDGLIAVTFKKCSRDERWEFSGGSYGRATVRYPEVIYPLDLRNPNDKDPEAWDLPQVRRVDPDMLPAMRFESFKNEFIDKHASLYGHVGNYKRAVMANY